MAVAWSLAVYGGLNVRRLRLATCEARQERPRQGCRRERTCPGLAPVIRVPRYPPWAAPRATRR